MHAVTHFNDSFEVKPPVKVSQSPSTSWKPRQTHSIAHHELLWNNYVHVSVNVETEGDDGGIIQLSVVAMILQIKKIIREFN